MSKLDEIVQMDADSERGSVLKQQIKDLFLDILDTANPRHDQNWYWKMRKEVEEL